MYVRKSTLLTLTALASIALGHIIRSALPVDDRSPAALAMAEVLESEKLMDRIIPPPKAHLERNLYIFNLEASNLGDLQKIKNCIVYTTCAGSSDLGYLRLPGNEKNTISVYATDSQLHEIISGCPWSRLPGRVVAKNGKTGEMLTIPRAEISDTDFVLYRKQLNPVLLSPDVLVGNRAILARIQKLIDDRNYREAIRIGLSSFDIELDHYDVKYQDSPHRGFNAETNSDYEILFNYVGDQPTNFHIEQMEKSITLYPPAFRNACELVSTLRHEAEHAFQHSRHIQCLKEDGLSTSEPPGLPFPRDSESYREKNAYLNDYGSISELCAGFPEHVRNGMAAAEKHFMEIH